GDAQGEGLFDHPPVARADDDRNQRQPRISELLGPELPAVHSRHHQVEKNHARWWRGAPHVVERFTALGDGDDVVALDLEGQCHCLALVTTVLDDQDVVTLFHDFSSPFVVPSLMRGGGRTAEGVMTELSPLPAALIGSVTVKFAPWPSPSLAALTVPPCSSTRSRTIANPRPSPPKRIAVPSAWRKRSKTWGRRSARMPCPVSPMMIVACFSSYARRTVTRPPLGVNLIAFENRFSTTCCRRSGSPATVAAAGASRVSTSILLPSAAGRTDSAASSIIVASSTGRTSRRTLPAMMRETSSSSPMRWA